LKTNCMTDRKWWPDSDQAETRPHMRSMAIRLESKMYRTKSMTFPFDGRVAQVCNLTGKDLLCNQQARLLGCRMSF
jgi:hypothetical protein